MYEFRHRRVRPGKTIECEACEPEELDEALKEKLALLDKFIETNNRIALAFSGGVDSSFLMRYAVLKGADVKPYYIVTPFGTDKEFKRAFNISNGAKTKLCPIKIDLLSAGDVVENTADRCYYCKKKMFGAILNEMAIDWNYYPVLVDGTNFSDDEGTRPGMKVLKELSKSPWVIEDNTMRGMNRKKTIRFYSPLRECKLTKDDIRKAARYFGMTFYNEPSNSCLATRIATGEVITDEKLRKIEFAENCLGKMGVIDCRAKLYGNDLVVKIHECDAKAAGVCEDILKNRVSGMFDSVVIDTENFR